ncbi:BBP7 family outer membrane beta-barrel protein [Dokdonella sp.]|uniref:BBP7 family outer membrane beta-barrel protein n=1 Tax=Dokdonella sp. TaxID=2291710 RepID=UPI0025BA42B4|nr:BBP7 family outer membrane beta-barrel protein [Dokdonella sp.]MBX3689571.1 BBP7 family outer membrane beta-barrel protein [Dokdonella sp.]
MRRCVLNLALLAGCAFSASPSAAPATTTADWSLSLDALSWESRDSPLGIPFISTGTLGQPGTQIVFGPRAAEFGSRRGARLSLSRAMSESSALEFSAFGLQHGSYGAGMFSDALPGSLHLYIPYIDPQTGQETSTDFSVPGLYSGAASLRSSERLRGAELDYRWQLPMARAFALDALIGVAVLNLDESMTLDTASPLLPEWGPDVWETHDAFSTRNRFHGLQVGLRARAERNGFYGSADFKLAAGWLRQQVDINGVLHTDDYTEFETVEQFPGGYFALPSNSGRHRRNTFGVMPQAELEFGYRFNAFLSAQIGYSAMYATRMLRPGPQVNRRIDTSQSTSYTEVPMPQPVAGAQPAFAFEDSNYFVHGIHAGITLTF